MAEIFAAVASGAGLISLAIQLLESSQRLKGFYTACRDAPQAVADLSFELETMSLSLRQLDSHRRADVLDDQLLDRCVMTCTRMNTKIETAVTKMDALLKRFRGVGRVYTAFKEPEMRKLLEDLEHAKSSMLFAYMSYCQSWNMREALKRTTEVHTQNALLSSNQAHLQSLDRAVETSHAAIMSKIETSVVQKMTTMSWSSNSTLNTASQRPGLRTKTKHRSSRTLRLALPSWLTNCVWQFAMRECEAGWNFQLRPVTLREIGSSVFGVVRSGNVEAVRKLIATGELSVSDHLRRPSPYENESLLTIAAENARLELCDFLLQEFPTYFFDVHMHEALMGFLGQAHAFDGFDSLTEAFYKLFIVKHGFSPDLYDLDHTHSSLFARASNKIEDVHCTVMLTENSLQDVIASQTIPFDRWSPTQRFRAAVNSRGWPADSFIKHVNFDTVTHLAQHKDARGKTALHWAAEHFGRWMSFEEYRFRGHKEQAHQREYGELVMKLIVAGADVHALDDTNQTPFACMLRSCTGWPPRKLEATIQRWGNILQDAGCSLPAYTEHENRLLAKFDSFAARVYVLDLGVIWTCRLTILESSTLAIEVWGSVNKHTWEYRAPPGAWRQNASQVDKISWYPDWQCDGVDWYLWRKTKNLVIKLSPTLLNAAPPSLEVSISSSWKELATGSQDDHGFVAASFQRTSNTSGQRRPRRRAISLPPPITMVQDDYNLPVAEKFLQLGRKHWLTIPHKCPLHLCWRSTCRSNPYDDVNKYRWCMQGLCDRPQHESTRTDHWEVLLLDDERNIEIARRSVDRFHPTWRKILEKNHLKAQRRAELEISVA